MNPAESVAEFVQRPLYRVSTGDLGTDVAKLGTQLRNNFRVGAEWGAVILLEGADALMVRRETEDLQWHLMVAGK